MLSPEHRIATQRRLGLEGPFRWFVEAAWPHVVGDAKPFVGGWHIDLLCDIAEAMHARQLRRVVINVPPGHSKSLIFCVLFNVWSWMRCPGNSFLYGSNDLSLPTRDGARVVALMRSAWFQDRWGDLLFLSSEKNPDAPEKDPAAGHLYTSARSFRLAVAPGGKGVGYHAPFRILDDPNKPGRVDSVEATKTNQWISNTFATRTAAGEEDVLAIVMQRLGANDASAYALANGYAHLNVPFDYDPKLSINTTGIGVGSDPRTRAGEIAWSPPHNEATRAQLKKDLGNEHNWQTQAQGNPRPKKGPVFNAEHLEARWYPGQIPEDAETIVVWDLALEDSDASDYVAGQAWALTQEKAYLLRRFKGRRSFLESIDLIRQWMADFAAENLTYVERKANGHAALNTLEKEFPGISERAIVPKESKFQRAMSVTHLTEGLRVVLPADDPTGNAELIEELTTFPFAANDDETDAFVHAMRVWDDKKKRMSDAIEEAERLGLDLQDIFGKLVG